MKHLVTGGCGFIGSNLVDRLIDEGHEVIVIDNLSAESNEEFYFNDKATYHHIDIRDFQSILPLFEGVHIVYHLAAEARIQPIINNPRLAVEVNVLGTCNVLESSRIHNIKRVIYSSTSSTYGLKNTPPLREDMTTDCLNSYCASKKSGEDLCKLYHTMWGLETVIFRYFNVYGEREPTKGQYAPVVGRFLKQVRNFFFCNFTQLRISFCQTCFNIVLCAHNFLLNILLHVYVCDNRLTYATIVLHHPLEYRIFYLSYRHCSYKFSPY
jgi:UDP-glucose 4-epimerase